MSARKKKNLPLISKIFITREWSNFMQWKIEYMSFFPRLIFHHANITFFSPSRYVHVILCYSILWNAVDDCRRKTVSLASLQRSCVALQTYTNRLLRWQNIVAKFSSPSLPVVGVDSSLSKRWCWWWVWCGGKEREKIHISYDWCDGRSSKINSL